MTIIDIYIEREKDRERERREGRERERGRDRERQRGIGGWERESEFTFNSIFDSPHCHIG